jgi:hypothetical protein
LYLDRFSHWVAQRKTNKTAGNDSRGAVTQQRL